MRYNGRTYVPLSSFVSFVFGLLALACSFSWTEEGEPVKAIVWVMIACALFLYGMFDD